MKRALQTTTWPTVLTGAFGLLLAVISLAWLAGFFLDVNRGVQTPRFSPEVASGLAAVAAILIGIRQWIADRYHERSKFYLESAVAGFQKAEAMLADNNNDKATWIGAARVLERSRRLTRKITVPEHLDLLEVEMDFQRKRFNRFLKHTASFYYGVGDVNLPLDDAARLSTAPNGNCTSTMHQIPEDAVYVIYDFMKYPKGYEDPKGGQFSEHELLFLGPRGYRGLNDYIEHIRAVHSASGNLSPRARRNNDDG